MKFGAETVEYVTCARCKLTVECRDGRTATGWGETPLSVTWVWPSTISYDERHESLKLFCETLRQDWAQFDSVGHPMEVGQDFITQRLADLLEVHNKQHNASEPMPWLAALVCCSLFDIALHDAYGNLHQCDVYSTYNGDWMNRSLADFLDDPNLFESKFPQDFLAESPPTRLQAWHLVGGADPLDETELTGSEPNDEYPVLLTDWIERDGLTCLKINCEVTTRPGITLGW